MAITHDSGFPLVGTLVDGTNTNATATLTTPGTNRLVVALVSANGVNNQGPYTVSGGGLTWARVGAGALWDLASGFTGAGSVDVWAALAPSVVTAQTITAAPTTAGARACQVALLSVTGHLDNAVLANNFANTGAVLAAGASTLADAASLTGTLVDSYVWWGALRGDANTAISAAANNTIDTDSPCPNTGARIVFGHYSGTLGGAVTAGGSTTHTLYTFAGVEIVASAAGNSTTAAGTSTAGFVGSALAAGVLNAAGVAQVAVGATDEQRGASAATLGTFDPQGRYSTLFDVTMEAAGWFDPELIGAPVTLPRTAIAGAASAGFVGGALAAGVLGAAGVGSFTPKNTPFSLAVSGRYLTNNGQPFHLNSDSAWMLSTNGVPSDLSTYFADCQSRGFNAVELMAIVHPGGTWGGGTVSTPNAPQCTASAGGGSAQYPFTTCVNTAGTGNTNFDTPNATYWAWIKSIVDAAEQHGVIVIFYFAYVSITGQGWNSALAEAHNTASSYAALTTYGQYLGTTFGANSNIIWGVAGDPSGTTGWEAGHRKILDAILSTSPASTLWTGEGDSNDGLTTELGSGVTFADAPINAQYGIGTGTTAGNKLSYIKSQEAYASPGTALFLSEPNYSGDFGATDLTVRPELYGSSLSGALVGANSGEADIWGWSANALTVLGSQSRLQRKYHHDLFAALPFHRLVPVLNAGGGATDFLTAGGGTYTSTGYKSRAITAAKDLAMVYFAPAGTNTCTLDMTVFSTSMRARWYDPTAGTFSAIGTYSNSGTQAFTTTGNNSVGNADWVLVLDVAPGGAVTAAGVGATSLVGGAAGQGALSAAGVGATALVGAAKAAGALSAAGLGATALVGGALDAGALSASGAGATAFVGGALDAGALSAAGVGATALVGGALDAGALGAAGIGSTAFAGAALGAGALNAAGLAANSLVGNALAAGVLNAAGHAATSIAPAGTYAFGAAGAGSAAFAGAALAVGTLTAAGLAADAAVGGAKAAGTFSAAALGSAAFAGPSGSSNVLGAAGAARASWAGGALSAAAWSWAAAGTFAPLAPGLPVIGPSESTLSWQDLTQTEATLASADATVLVATITWEPL